MASLIPEIILEAIRPFVPSSDWGRLAALLIIAFSACVLTGRFKLEWLGAPVKYLWGRCVKCPRGNHAWRLPRSGIRGFVSFDEPGIEGVHICKYCGKQDYFRSV